MSQFSIGVILDSFRTDIYSALDKASSLEGVKGFQVYATQGEMSPEQMDSQKRKDFRKAVEDHGLTISALCGDLGHGFTNPQLNPQLIEKSKRILDLAVELGTKIVTTHIGVVPEDPKDPRYSILQEACGQLAEYADSLHAHFAVETGPEKASVLGDFLDSLHSTGVAVNLDPANFIMVAQDDPVQAVYRLKDYIVHTHAKDGRHLSQQDPTKLYSKSPEEILADPSYIELPLGQGDVDFPRYLNALKDVGYHGFLTIEREVGDDPEGDISNAVEFLKKLIHS